MSKMPYFALDYYNRAVVGSIINKYALEPMDAARSFLLSKTHALLEDAENGLWCYPTRAIFDMWEAEQITGDPRNSLSLRAE